MKRRKVLSDHKKSKQNYIAPFNQIQEITPLSWVNEILPEFLWVGISIYLNGEKNGIDSVRKICLKAQSNFPESNKLFFSASSFLKLQSSQKHDLKLYFQHNLLNQLEPVLRILSCNYNNYPLAFLVSDNCKKDIKWDDDEKLLKSVMREMIDKHTRLAIYTQATYISIAFESGKLHVTTDADTLTKLDLLNDYPRSEDSKMVAAAVRSSVPALFKFENEKKEYAWSKRFWNENLNKSKCDLESIYE